MLKRWRERVRERRFWRDMQRGVDQAAVSELYLRAIGDEQRAKEAREFAEIMAREFEELRPPKYPN